jgi:hypothetical protein
MEIDFDLVNNLNVVMSVLFGWFFFLLIAFKKLSKILFFSCEFYTTNFYFS